MSSDQMPQRNLTTFQPKPICDMCGSNNCGMVFHPRPVVGHTCHPYLATLHLCVTCRNCQYEWSMETWDGVPYATQDED